MLRDVACQNEIREIFIVSTKITYCDIVTRKYISVFPVLTFAWTDSSTSRTFWLCQRVVSMCYQCHWQQPQLTGRWRALVLPMFDDRAIDVSDRPTKSGNITQGACVLEHGLLYTSNQCRRQWHGAADLSYIRSGTHHQERIQQLSTSEDFWMPTYGSQLARRLFCEFPAHSRLIQQGVFNVIEESA